MAIYQIRKGDLVPIKEKMIDLEKDLQKLTEKNLQTVFGLEFVRTEFGLHNLYIDTLAFDPESKSFAIIEYKRDKSFSVVDQGYACLALMLNNKADFILEYNEREKGNLKPRLCSRHLLRREKPCCKACFTILLLNIFMNMPSAQNRSTFASR